MNMQTMEEYRQELASLKKDLGWDVLNPEGKDREDLVRGVLQMARGGRGAPRKVRGDDDPRFTTRDPLADVLLAVLHR